MYNPFHQVPKFVHEVICPDLYYDMKKRKSGQEKSGQSQSLKAPTLQDIRWNKMFELLLQQRNFTGSCDVPLSFTVADASGAFYKLGTWLGTQRQQYRKHSLSDYKLQKLQALVTEGSMSWGPVESKVVCDDAKWETMFGLLLDYGEEHGDCNVPERLKVAKGSPSGELDNQGEDGSNLGKWLQRQRHGMKMQSLRADRMVRMQQLVNSGLLVVDEVAEGDLSWQRHYAALMDYAQAFQHCNVHYDYEVEIAVLPEHVGSSASVTEPEVEPTGQLPGHDAKHSASNDGAEGKAEGSKVTLQLGRWLQNQRHAHNRADRMLRADRAAQLQVLVDRGMLKWRCSQLSSNQKWDETFSALERYCVDHAWMAAGTERASAKSTSANSGSLSDPAPNSGPSSSSHASSAEAPQCEQAPSNPPPSSRIEWSHLQKMQPFAGAAVLSDGSAVQLFPWLQRQFAGLNVQGPAAGTGSSQKINVNTQRAEKLLCLLSKNSGIFDWQNNSSQREV